MGLFCARDGVILGNFAEDRERLSGMGRSVLVEREGAIATVTLNRPEARNALNRAMRRELLAAMQALAKSCLLQAQEVPLSAGLHYEAEMYALCFASDDVREGIRAFLEKRKPEFKGLPPERPEE